MLFNCSVELRAFHDEDVTLPQDARKEMRERRDANEDRLISGLKQAGDPSPLGFVKQGSYAMHTMVQHPANDYDIDDGVRFAKNDLKGSQGADKTSLDARSMVCDAVQDDRFTTPPEIRKNCVRVFYNEGYHIDLPVYRESESGGMTILELASAGGWKTSDPTGVTRWFNECLDVKQKMGAERDQLRRIVRYFKAFSRSRKSWSMPSGFILTVLCNDYFVSDTRDDVSLYNTFANVAAGISDNLVVMHPVLLGETITHTESDAKMETFREKLNWALEQLAVLSDNNCTKKSALKAWAEVFNTSFFEENYTKEAACSFYINAGAVPSQPIEKDGGGSYA